MEIRVYRKILERNTQISNFMKSLSVGEELLHATDGLTDR